MIMVMIDISRMLQFVNDNIQQFILVFASCINLNNQNEN